VHLLDVNVSERCISVTLDTTIYRQLNEWIKGTAYISEGTELLMMCLNNLTMNPDILQESQIMNSLVPTDRIPVGRLGH